MRISNDIMSRPLPAKVKFKILFLALSPALLTALPTHDQAKNDVIYQLFTNNRDTDYSDKVTNKQYKEAFSDEFAGLNVASLDEITDPEPFMYLGLSYPDRNIPDFESGNDDLDDEMSDIRIGDVSSTTSTTSSTTTNTTTSTTTTTTQPNFIDHMFSMLNTPIFSLISTTHLSDNEIPISPDQTIKEYLFQYGCYCFPNNFESTKSRFDYNSDSLDEIDELCRNLYRAQKCLKWDFDDGEKFCDVSLDYVWYRNLTKVEEGQDTLNCGDRSILGGELVTATSTTTSTTSTEPATTTDQSKENSIIAALLSKKSTCSKENCNLEKLFINNLFRLLSEGVRKNENYHMEDQQYQNRCYKGKGQIDANNVKLNTCCGVDLYRKPFNSEKFVCEDGKEAIKK